MRTTLDIADDVLFAAKELAKREKKTIGEVISNLARESFQPKNYPVGSVNQQPMGVSERIARYGIEPLASRGAIVSNEMIDQIRDQEGI
jgi:hypothetical protein